MTPATLHWIGAAGAGGDMWGTAANWLENAVPASGDRLIFDSSFSTFSASPNGFAPNNNLAGLTNLTIGINDSSSGGDFAISGNAFGLSTTAGTAITTTVSVGTGAKISNDIALGANTTVAVGYGKLELAGIVSGAFALNAAGSPASTLTLSAANTFASSTLTSGTVALSNNSALGAGLITFNGGRLAKGASTPQLANAFTVNAPSSIEIAQLDGAGTLNSSLTLSGATLNGVLSGAGGLIQNGFANSSTIGGTAANTFTGGVTIVSGGVNLKKTAGMTAVASPITLVGGGPSSGSLTLEANNQIDDGVAIALGNGTTFNTNGFSDTVLSLTGVGSLNTGTMAAAGLTISGGGDQLLTGAVSGSGLLAYTGSGTLTLSGKSSGFSGTLTAGGELLVAGDFSGATAKVTGGVLGGTGIVKTINATSGFVDAGTTGTSGVLTVAATATASTLAGSTFRVDLGRGGDQLVLGGGVTLNLAGTTLLADNVAIPLESSYAIVTSPSGGITGTFTGLPEAATVAVGGQTFRINYTSKAVTLTNLGTSRQTLHWIGTTNDWNVASNWAENKVPTSGNTLVFDTTYPGFAGTPAAFSSGNTISGLTNMSIIINDSSTAGDFTLGGVQSIGLVDASGVGISSTVTVGSGASINNNLVLAANTTVQVGFGTLTLGGVVSGAFSLVEMGSPAGELVLRGANTFSGGVTISSGTVTAGNESGFGTGTIKLNGGTLSSSLAFPVIMNPFVVSAPSTIAGNLFMELAGKGTLNADLRLIGAGSELALTGALSGPGALIQDESGLTTELGGTEANTFTGPLVINGGTVTLFKTLGVNAVSSSIVVRGNASSVIRWGESNQLNGTVPIDLAVGGTINMSGFSDTVPSLTGIGDLNTGFFSSDGLTVSGSTPSFLNGAVTGGGLLRYTGLDTLTLGGNSAGFSGKLNVTSGSLLVQADFSNARASTQGTGTFGGTGIIGSVPTGSVALLNPGGVGVAGILTTSGASVLSGQVFRVDVSDKGLSDQLVLRSGATINLTGATLNGTVLSGSLGSVYTIITSPSGGITGTFNGLADNAVFTLGGRQMRIKYTANAVTLTDLQSITLSPLTLPPAQVGVPYNQVISSTGGTGAVTLVVSSVVNPAGLTIPTGPSGTITISGTPTAFGTISFMVTPSDSLGAQGGTIYTIPVTGPVPTLTSIDDGDADNSVAVNTIMTYTVTFSGDIDAATVTAADFNNAGTAAVTFGTITETSPGVFAVQVTPTTTGTIILRIPAGSVISEPGGSTLGGLPLVDNDTVTVIPDTFPPTVVSIDDGIPDNLTTPGVTLSYVVTFNEDINAATVTAADFDNAGTADILIGTIIEASPGVFAVQVTPVSPGTIILRIPTGSVISDVANNNLVVPVVDTDTVIVQDDIVPPTVVSIDDGDGDNSVFTKTTLTYTVTFSEDIDDTTVTAADFNNAGTATITIGAITETAPGVFTVEVTPTTTGTLNLRIPTGAVITDLGGNNLVVPVLDNDTVNVIADIFPPTVVSIDEDVPSSIVATGTKVTYTVSFSEDINDATVSAADFGNAGTATITIGSITETSPGVFSVVVTPTSEGTLIFRIPPGAVIADTSGNKLAVPVEDNNTINVDGTGPVVTITGPSVPVTANGPVTYTVTYTDPNFNTSTLNAADITLNKTGTADGTLSVDGSGTSWTVTISNTSGAGTIGISIREDTASDKVGNLALVAGPSTTFTVDNKAPIVTISSPSLSVTAGKSVSYTVTYSPGGFSKSTLTVDDITLNKTGTADGTVSVTGSGNTRTVTIDNVTGDGSLSISIPASTGVDRAGNFAEAAGPSTAVVVANIELFALGGADGSIRVLDATGAVRATLAPLNTPNSPYVGLLSVALGDMTGDGVADLFVASANPSGVLGLDPSKAGKVFVYDGAAIITGGNPAPFHTFTPFATTSGPFGTNGAYTNGLNIAVGDINGDGVIDLVAGTRGGSATAGLPEYGRLAVISAGAAADGSADTPIGSVVTPFGPGYLKGVVVAAGNLDGVGGDEIAVTRGGPVAASNPNKSVKLKAYKLAGADLTELDLNGDAPGAFAPFPTINRDARLAFVDPDGDGRDDLVFAALDRSDPTSTDVRIATFYVDTTTGFADARSTGSGPSKSYRLGFQVEDFAISAVDVARDGSSDLALLTQRVSTVQFLDPSTGTSLPGSFNLDIVTGGISFDGI